MSAELLEMLGLRVAKADSHTPRHTTVHEAGHAMVALRYGLAFVDVSLEPPDEPMLAGRLRYHDGASWRVTGPTRAVRLSMDLGGVVAEALVFGSVRARPGEEDLRKAFARVGAIHDVSPEQLGEVRDAVRSTRMNLCTCGRRPAIDAVARALKQRRTLTRLDAAIIAWQAGALIQVQPTWEHLEIHQDWAELRAESARVLEVVRAGRAGAP